MPISHCALVSPATLYSTAWRRVVRKAEPMRDQAGLVSRPFAQSLDGELRSDSVALGGARSCAAHLSRGSAVDLGEHGIEAT